MSYEILTRILYVTKDGNYGADDIIITDLNSLTDEQIEQMSSLSDNDRFAYVQAVLDGQDTSEWED
jgi:hypothetical protein